MQYKIKYRRFLFWKTKTIVGHKVEDNTLVLFYQDGGLETVAGWNRYSLRLGTDWVLAAKKNMESQSGVDIKLNM